MKQIVLFFLFSFLFAHSSCTQSNFSVDQKVEVLWKGRWYKADILAVNGNAYKIHYEGYASSLDETVPENRIRTSSEQSKTGAFPIKYGKYNCTVSKYFNGSYEYLPKGSFVLSKDGSYTYYGFAKPSKGKFKLDNSGVIIFSGGYFKGGQATPIEGQKNRYYIVFPTNSESRWTSSWVSEK